MAKDTKQILLNSFLELLGKKDITQITETDLANLSGITRFTIRNNFGKNFAIAIIDFIYKKIADTILEKLSAFDPHDMTAEIFADLILPVVWKYQGPIKILFKANAWRMGDDGIFLPFYKWAEPFFQEQYERQKKELTQLNAYDLYSIWVQQLILYLFTWLSKPVPEEPRIFKKTLLHLANNSLMTLVGKK